MSEEAPAYKALAFASTHAALKKMIGPDPYDVFLEALTTQTRALVQKPLPATDWVPLAALDETYRTAHKLCFDGDADAMYALGCTKFSNDLHGIYKVFIRVLDPSAVLKRAPSVYTTYMRNNGAAISGALEKNRATLSWSGIRIPSVAYWEVQRGMTTAAAEATRMKNVISRFTRGGPNDSSREVEITWR